MRQFRSLRRLVLLIVLLSVFSAAAQDAQTIAPGDTLTGALTAEVNSVNYDVAASAVPLLLTVTTDAFPPTFGLGYTTTRGGGFSVSFDGDVGNPLFLPPLAEGGAVQVQVTSTQFPAAGEFTLSAVAVEVAPISPGASAAGSIEADGTPRYFSFEAQLGKLVTLAVQGANGFDTRLQWFNGSRPARCGRRRLTTMAAWAMIPKFIRPWSLRMAQATSRSRPPSSARAARSRCR